jgi:hypothetical protein
MPEWVSNSINCKNNLVAFTVAAFSFDGFKSKGLRVKTTAAEKEAEIIAEE